MSTKKKPQIVAVGLDNNDGHKRITKGPDFIALSGSKETHELMTEKAIRLGEKLKKRGKTVETASFEEFDDAAHSVGLVRGDEAREAAMRRQKSN